MSSAVAAQPRSPLARLGLPALVLALAAPIRIWAAVSDQGIFWPDEIYQSLEQAHRFAFGNGLIPWEFEQGARSWLFPGLLGLLWKLAAALGVRDPLTLVVLAKLVVVAVGLAGILAAMRLAQRLAGPNAALLAGTLCATFPALVVYAARCMTETVSGPLLVGAALLVLEPGVRRARWAALLASSAVFFRYQNGLVTASLLVWLLLERRFRDAKVYALVAVLVGLAGGALDWITWGVPFKSFIEYVKFNLIEGKSKQWGTSPFSFYAVHLWSSTGPLLLLVLAGIALAWERARALVLVMAAFVLAHCLIPHKELRFLVPILPLALALSGAGLARGLELIELGRWWPALLFAASFVMIGLPASLGARFRDLGQYTDNGNGDRSVWHADEDPNRALLDAAHRDDLCGMIVAGIHPAWMGGYSYLGKDVPFFFRGGPTELAAANYLVAPAGARLPEGFSTAGEHGTFSLYRRDGPCAPRPASWRPILP